MLRNGLEPWHLLVVALVFILLFGSKKLPDAARGLGKSMRILKSEARAMKNDEEPASGAAASPTTVSEAPAVEPTSVVTPSVVDEPKQAAPQV